MDPKFLVAQLVTTPEFHRMFYRTQAFGDAAGVVSCVGKHSVETSEFLGWTAPRLGLDGDRCRLSGMVHDIGKGPYGHPAEEVLKEWVPGHSHAAHGVEVLERMRIDYGLDFSDDVKADVGGHSNSLDSTEFQQLPAAAQLLGIADKGAHVCADTIDGLQAGLIVIGDIPEKTRSALGTCPQDWMIALSDDLVASNGPNAQSLTLSESVRDALVSQKGWLVENVYGPFGRGYLNEIHINAVLRQLSYKDGRTGSAADKQSAVYEFCDMTDHEVLGFAETLVPEFEYITGARLGGDNV